MDDLVVTDELVEYRWTFTGTSAETGKPVRIPGSEEWTIRRRGGAPCTRLDVRRRSGCASASA